MERYSVQCLVMVDVIKYLGRVLTFCIVTTTIAIDTVIRTTGRWHRRERIARLRVSTSRTLSLQIFFPSLTTNHLYIASCKKPRQVPTATSYYKELLLHCYITLWNVSVSQSLIAPLVNSVASLRASSSSKTDILNIWCKNCRMWQLL